MEKKIIVVIPSYNNAQWYEKNLNSVVNQNYSNYHIIYTDDCSTDGTAELVEKYIKLYNKENLVTLIKNNKNVGAMENLYNMIYSCDDTDLCIILDGDDNLDNNNVLQRINEEYKKDIWLSYGSYVDYPGMTRGCAKLYEKEVIEKNAFRYVQWRASHMRTFYAKLFKQIKKEDLMHEGSYVNTTYDLFMMFPMIELCGNRFSYIDDILYHYNNLNSISDCKIKLSRQGFLDGVCRRKPRYNKLDKLF